MSDTLRGDLEAAMTGKVSDSRAIAEAIVDEFPDLDLNHVTPDDLKQMVDSGALPLTDSDHEDMRTLCRLIGQKQGGRAQRQPLDPSLDKIDRLSALLDKAERLNASRSKH